MQCPNCQTSLHKTNIGSLEAWHCPSCLGFFVEHKELSRLSQNPPLNWLDVELWEDPQKFSLSSSARLCPLDSAPLYALEYGDVTLDVCPTHRGIWFDAGELSKITHYVTSQLSSQTLADLLHQAGKELEQITYKSEHPLEDTKHLLLVLDLASHRVAARFPLLSQIAARLPQ